MMSNYAKQFDGQLRLEAPYDSDSEQLRACLTVLGTHSGSRFTTEATSGFVATAIAA